MVSLRERKKADLVGDVLVRTAKIPKLIDEDEIIRQVERTIRILDERMFNPRNFLFDNSLVADGSFVDVTPLMIDEINNVYYAAETNQVAADVGGLGLGLLPFLSSSTNFFSLESVIDYINLQSVLNMMSRHMNLYGDWELWPVDAQGRQKLQINNSGKLFRIEYLPYLNPELDSWYLYENEYQFVKELAYLYTCHVNAELQSQALLLGVAKDAITIVNYWDKKITEWIKQFVDSSIITYIQ
jgi:hypothetical protein